MVTGHLSPLPSQLEDALRVGAQSQTLSNPSHNTVYSAPSPDGLQPRDPQLSSPHWLLWDRPYPAIHSEYNPQGLAVSGAQHYSLWLTSVPHGASRVVGGQAQGLWGLALDSDSALISCGQAVDK